MNGPAGDTSPCPEWKWVITVSDWPIGRADYDLTPGEAIAALTRPGRDTAGGDQ